MRVAIGIGVSADAIRAVAVRRQRVLLALETSRSADESLSDAISAMLARIPGSRWRRCMVCVAVGPHSAQVKRLEGLPPGADPDVLERIVREAAGSFFLRNGTPLSTTGVRRTRGGAVWAGAIDSEDVDSIRAACRASRFRLRCIVPTAVALPLGLKDSRITWPDGDLLLDIQCSTSGVERVRRLPAVDQEYAASSGTPVPGLARIGDQAARFADAFGAILIPTNEPLSLGPFGPPRSGSGRKRRSMTMAGLLGLLALALGALSPLSIIRQAEKIQGERTELRASPAWVEAAATASRLAQIGAVLDEIDHFAVDRADRISLLAAIAANLPEGSALLRFEVEDRDGRIVAVTPRVTSLMAALREIPAIASVGVHGRTAQEMIDGRALERATLSFRLADPATAASHVRTAP